MISTHASWLSLLTNHLWSVVESQSGNSPCLWLQSNTMTVCGLLARSGKLKSQDTSTHKHHSKKSMKKCSLASMSVTLWKIASFWNCSGRCKFFSGIRPRERSSTVEQWSAVAHRFQCQVNSLAGQRLSATELAQLATRVEPRDKEHWLDAVEELRQCAEQLKTANNRAQGAAARGNNSLLL